MNSRMKTLTRQPLTLPPLPEGEGEKKLALSLWERAEKDKILDNHKLGEGCLTVIILCLFFLLLAPSANAWRITPELQKELKEKQSLVKANPNDADARFDLAITMAYTNNIQDGWTNLKKTVELDPEFRKKGLEHYIKKVTESPNDWRLRFRLAFAYYFNDKKKEAIRELDNVLKLDPYNVWAYGYSALIHGELGNVDAAIDSTKKGLKIDSDVAALHLLLAESYNRKGDRWGAFAEAVEAVRLRALGY